jgi:hypothetical protein
MCSRSVSDKYLRVGGAADGANCDGGIPPHSRNHRVPTGCDTPAISAASSLEHPRAIASQNGRRRDRCNTGGRPGDRIFARPARSDRRFLVTITTLLIVRCCNDRLNPPNILVFGTATGSPSMALRRPSAPPATPTTTRLRSRSLVCSRLKSFGPEDLGEASRRSSTQRSSGWTGSTIGVCSSPWATFRPRSSSWRTISNVTIRLWRPDSHKMASGETGAVQASEGVDELG